MTSIATTRPTPKMRHMRRHAPIRFIAATILSAAALSHAQPQTASNPAVSASSALPATAPTTAPPLTPAQSPAQHAKITYTDNMIAVAASNSSLNQILHDISRLTGIKITGGVTDERVFGDYGPASPSQVLATLLNGTGSNMLLIHGTGDTPTELILTPRQGGPTPPNPNAQSFEETSESSDDAPPNPVARPIRHQPPSPYAPRPISPPDNPAPTTNDTTAPAPQGDSTAQPSSPTGVKTPQQIYDELQRLRQQQSKPQQ
jgi:hypothetical protein